MVQVKKGSNQGPEVYLILEMLLKIDCTSQKENLVEKYVFTWKGLVQVRSPLTLPPLCTESVRRAWKPLRRTGCPSLSLGPCFPKEPDGGCPSFVLCSSKCLLHAEARVSLRSYIQTSLLCLQLSTGLPSPRGFTPSPTGLLAVQA